MLIEAPVHDSVLYNAWHVVALADDVKVDQPLQVNSWVNRSPSGGSKTRLLPAKIAALIGVGRFRRDGLAPLGQSFVRIMQCHVTQKDIARAFRLICRSLLFLRLPIFASSII